MNESFNEPGVGVPDSNFIQLSDDDLAFIETSDILKELLDSERISIDGDNKLWYFVDDINIVDTLSNFFDINESVATFSDYMKEDVFYSDYDDMSDDIINRLRKFIYDWKDTIDSESLNIKGEFDINDTKYKYSVTITKQ